MMTSGGNTYLKRKAFECKNKNPTEFLEMPVITIPIRANTIGSSIRVVTLGDRRPHGTRNRRNNSDTERDCDGGSERAVSV